MTSKSSEGLTWLGWPFSRVRRSFWRLSIIFYQILILVHLLFALFLRKSIKVNFRINFLEDKFKYWFITDYYNKSIHIFACMSVCLTVCPFASNKRQNGWTDRIGPKFFVGPRVTLGKVYGDRIFKNLPSSKFYFWKFWKFRQCFLNPQF